MSVAAGGYLYTRPTQFLSYGAINVSAGGTLQISGESGDTSTINSITNAGTVSITDNISNISTFSGGTLSVSYFSSVNVGRLSGLNNLSVGYPGSVAVNQQLPSQVNPAAIPSNSTQTLTISTYSAGLDVTNNSLLINYGIGADPKNTIIQYLASGSNGGSWNGLSGIISSTAAAQGINGHYGVGYADGADGIDSSLAAGQLEVAYTLYGDMTLQGVVDITDLNLFAQYYGKVVSGGWAQGDFLGTGTVNATDFGLLAANFGQTTNGTNAQLPASEFEALDAFADENGLDAYLPEPPTFAPCVLLAIFGAARPKRRKVGRDLEVAGS
jgi:hypothetical protein